MQTNGDNHRVNADNSERAKKLMKAAGPVENVEGEDPGFSTSILSLLPEIWEQILPHLSSEDFLSVINSCPMWREMFKTATTSKLLPLVLYVLVNHNMSEIDFLRWRSVNHTTKSVIESVLRREASSTAYWENLTTHNISWSHSVEEAIPRRLIENLKKKYSLLFTSPSVWNDWVTYLKPVLEGSPEINPFLTQNLHLLTGQPVGDINPAFQPYNYLPYLHLILGQIGGCFVTSFTAEIAVWTRTTDYGIFTMLSCLAHLPLLKILKVKGDHVCELFSSIRAMDNRYPTLEHLETLDVSEYPDPITVHGGWERKGLCFMLLKHYGRQLTTFLCSRKFFEGPASVQLLKRTSLPNLRCVGVVNPSMNSIAALANVDLNLEEVYLSGSTPLKFRSVVRALNSFAPSLVHLRLYLRPLDSDSKEVGENTEEEDKVMKVKFPKLKRISTHLGNGGEKCFWQFVEQKCDSLEEIVMNARNRDGEEEKLRRGFELVPTLKKIIIYSGYANEDEVPEKIVLFRNGNRMYERKFRKVERDN